MTPFGVHASLDRLTQSLGLALLHRVQVIQAPQEEEVGDLFDHLDRISNAAGPEGIPECVDFAAEFASEHVMSLFESWVGCVGSAAVGLNAQAWPGFGSKDLISARLAMTTCFSPFLGVPLASKLSVLSV